MYVIYLFYSTVKWLIGHLLVWLTEQFGQLLAVLFYTADIKCFASDSITEELMKNEREIFRNCNINSQLTLSRYLVICYKNFYIRRRAHLFVDDMNGILSNGILPKVLPCFFRKYVSN